MSFPDHQPRARNTTCFYASNLSLNQNPSEATAYENVPDFQPALGAMHAYPQGGGDSRASQRKLRPRKKSHSLNKVTRSPKSRGLI